MRTILNSRNWVSGPPHRRGERVTYIQPSTLYDWEANNFAADGTKTVEVVFQVPYGQTEWTGWSSYVVSGTPDVDWELYRTDDNLEATGSAIDSQTGATGAGSGQTMSVQSRSVAVTGGEWLRLVLQKGDATNVAFYNDGTPPIQPGWVELRTTAGGAIERCAPGYNFCMEYADTVYAGNWYNHIIRTDALELDGGDMYGFRLSIPAGEVWAFENWTGQVYATGTPTAAGYGVIRVWEKVGATWTQLWKSGTRTTAATTAGDNDNFLVWNGAGAPHMTGGKSYIICAGADDLTYSDASNRLNHAGQDAADTQCAFGNICAEEVFVHDFGLAPAQSTDSGATWTFGRATCHAMIGLRQVPVLVQ